MTYDINLTWIVIPFVAYFSIKLAKWYNREKTKLDEIERLCREIRLQELQEWASKPRTFEVWPYR